MTVASGATRAGPVDRSPGGTAFTLTGPATAPVVVMIHGIGLHKGLWTPYEPLLVEHFRVLTYDLYGHGGSTPPPSIPSLGLYSDQLRELLDSLEIRTCSLLGFSLGGMINRRFAIDVADRCEALVILNSPHERGEAEQRAVEARAAMNVAGGPAATLESTLERWFTADFRAAHPEVVARIGRWVVANDPVAYAQCRQVLATGVTELVRPRPPIDKPTLVMTCENDSGSTPAMTLAIAGEIHGAQTVIVPGLQHMGLLEQPEQFIKPIRAFLKETLKTPSSARKNEGKTI